MSNLINKHKLLNHLQNRIDLLALLADGDEHFEEAVTELRTLREEILVDKYAPAIWE